MSADAVPDVLLKGLSGNLSDGSGGFGIGLDPLCFTYVLDNTLKSRSHRYVRLNQNCLFGGVVRDSYLQMKAGMDREVSQGSNFEPRNER